MAKVKISVSIDKKYIVELDRFIYDHVFANRNQAIQQAVGEKLLQLKRTRLAIECEKLDPQEEQSMAEEGMAEDMKDWPEY